MTVLICYATSEGQTRKIARHVLHKLADAGHAAELLPCEDASDVDLSRYDRSVLAASIHLGHYQKDFATFAASHAEALSRINTLFLSVCLAAAGHDAEDWRALDKIVQDFSAATGFAPNRTEQIAGAYLPSRYDVFRRYAMRRIIRKEDPEADPDADKEYTDWAALDTIVDRWLSA